MNIVTQAKELMVTVGAAPIMYLMIALSIASLAVMLERLWFFLRTHDDPRGLCVRLESHLRQSDLRGARETLAASASPSAQVVLAGLNHVEHGVAAVEDAMRSANAVQRGQLERGLGYLGTLGNNAPFVGLFGTVIGIIMAFDELGKTGQSGSPALMSSIAEALVATAIGLAVAIPAVAAYNHFQRRIRAIGGHTEALSHVLIGWLHSGAMGNGRGGHASMLSVAMRREA